MKIERAGTISLWIIALVLTFEVLVDKDYLDILWDEHFNNPRKKKAQNNKKRELGLLSALGVLSRRFESFRPDSNNPFHRTSFPLILFYEVNYADYYYRQIADKSVVILSCW